MRESINEEGILNLGGVYGDKDVGDPVDYDHCWQVQASDVVDAEIFDRRIAFFMTKERMEEMRVC